METTERDQHKSNKGKKATAKAKRKVTLEYIEQFTALYTPEQFAADIAKLQPRDRVQAMIKLFEFSVPKPQRMVVNDTDNCEQQVFMILGQPITF
jgi:hypothetical protein